MLKGYRTVILGLIVGILGTIKAIAAPDVQTDMPTPEAAEAAFDAVQLIYSWGSAVAIWVMRAITTSPLGKKE